jgi:hypothetical protein
MRGGRKGRSADDGALRGRQYPVSPLRGGPRHPRGGRPADLSTVEEVKRSLINHDGYDAAIRVTKAARRAA